MVDAGAALRGRRRELSLDAGRTLAIVGESGCGKSVTALSIMGLVAGPPGRVSGEIVFDGAISPRSLPATMRELRGNRLTMIFQEPMTSLNPGPHRRRADRRGSCVIESGVASGRDERAIEMLRQVRIPSPEKRFADYPHQFSGGMRQRVMIAMALSCDPQLLIADEPTTALDVTIQAQILDLMRTLARRNRQRLSFSSRTTSASSPSSPTKSP